MKVVWALVVFLGIWLAVTYYDIPLLPGSFAHAVLVHKADRGDTDAMVELDENYETGGGGNVDRDIAKAVEWYKRALFGRNPKAHYHLGKLALHGKDIIKQNLPFAIEHLEAAAEKSILSAFISIGHAYEHGLGYDQNLHIAYFNYYIADQLGSNSGTRNKYRLSPLIPRQTRAKVESEAQENLASLKRDATWIRVLRDFSSGKTLSNLRKMESKAGTLDPLTEPKAGSRKN